MRTPVWLGAGLVAAMILAVWTPSCGTDDGQSRPDPGAVAGDPAERRGALVDQVVFTEESDPGRIVGQIERGTRHVLAQGVNNPTIYQQLRASGNAAFDLSYGSSAELTLNPAGPELDDGTLNPFHVPAIREALNWLLDRRYIANELYGGLAEPRYLPLSTAFPDYARLADVARELELRYRHDPKQANEVITREMRALGAERVDGRWRYGGAPVRIRMLIRTEDARREVGDYVADRLAELGFAVERLYRTAEQAAPIWFGSDPAAGRWHIYTGGWVSTVINRDEAQALADFYTPSGRPSPLWQAYDPAPELADIAQRLQRRDYATRDERQTLMARGLELAMEDSVRVWLVDQLSLWARAADVALATDLAGGVAGSLLWPYTLRFRDRVGGEMVVSVPSVLTEPWNPVAGTGWLYDRMILNGLQDEPLLPDPFTGLFRPQRIAGATVTVVEGTPVQRTHDWLTLRTRSRIEVPADAWIAWDGGEGRLVTVGERHPDGLTARTRTRVRYEDGYLERRWHDGSRMSLADLVLPWILQFERADEDSPLFDRSHLPDFTTFRGHFRGWRIVSRDPLVVDVYSDQIYPDAETIVAARTPSVQPWHVLALGIRAERSGELAFSSDKADRSGVTWLSLASGPSLPVLDRHLREARERAEVPFPGTLSGYMADGEAESRYRTLATWRTEHGHYWVGDGPFYLDSVHPVEGSLVLRRFEGFPDRGDKWLRFTEARIPEPSLDGPMTVRLDREAAVFRLDIAAAGEPYPAKAVETVDYLLFDSRGRLAHRGEARPTEDGGGWAIRLPPDRIAALGAGANRLEVVVRSRLVALPRFASHVFATVPAAEEPGR